jgi:hypothetical protein
MITSKKPRSKQDELIHKRRDYIHQRSEIELDNIRWRNRRRMAWLALIATLVATILFPFLSVGKITALESVVGWFYMSMSSVVAAYVGTAAYADVAKMRRQMGMRSPYDDEIDDNQQYENSNNEGDVYGDGRLNGISMDPDYYKLDNH